MGVKIRQPVKGRGHPWYVYINHNGKRKSVKAGTKAQAEKLKKKTEEAIAADKLGLDDDASTVPTFKEWAEKFMKTYSKQNHKAATRRSFRGVLDHYLLPEFGNKRLDKIDRDDVKNFLYRLLDTDKKHGEGKLSVSSVKLVKAYMSSIMSEAVDSSKLDTVTANPAAKMGKVFKGKQARKGEINPLSWDEVQELEAAIKERAPRYWELFLVLLRTGMRLGEAMALKPGDLDFVNGYIRIERNFSGGRITTPKSGKERKVYLTSELREALDSYLTKRKKEAMAKGWGKPPEYLFYNEAGGPLDDSHLRNRIFYKVLEKAKMRRIRIHDLRHTYASLRLGAGHNIKDIQEQLGHHSVAFTLDVYGHLMKGEHRSQVEELSLPKSPNGKAVNGNE